MKLLRLKINDDFRGLKAGFEINFFNGLDMKSITEFAPYCFIGRNGSGKSNVLEALANIFFSLECKYLEDTPKGFKKTEAYPNGFDSIESIPDAYELEYLIKPGWMDESSNWEEGVRQDGWGVTLRHVKIIKKRKNNPRIFERTWKYSWDQEDEFDEVNKSARDFLPELVVGYSSGENEILSLPFFKMRFINYDEYLSKLTSRKIYDIPEGRLIYIDNQLSQAIMLSNYLLQKEKYLAPFKKELGINKIETFRLIVERNAVPGNIKRRKINFLENLEEKIEKLKKCATTTFFDKETETLYLDYFIDDNNELKGVFKKEFSTPINLFRTLQIFLNMNLYAVDQKTKLEVYHSKSLYVSETVPVIQSDKRVLRFKDFTLIKKGVKNNILSKSLSDGEHQFLHSMGICLLLRDTNALFLLDEPETHFNPEWRSRFITTLKECLEGAEGEESFTIRDLLITTHSPFIISDCKKENVKWFVKEEKKGTKEVTINTFGTSITKIMDEFFDSNRQIADLSWNEMLDDLKSNDVTELNDALSKFGDSREKNMILQKLNKIILENREEE